MQHHGRGGQRDAYRLSRSRYWYLISRLYDVPEEEGCVNVHKLLRGGRRNSGGEGKDRGGRGLFAR